MALTEKQRVAARERKRLQRKREALRQVVGAEAGDDDPADPRSGQIAPDGIEQPSEPSEFSGDLMREQARWVHERCKITRLEYRRRLGELIPVDDARRQTAALARRIRQALDRAPSHLPADLSPEIRAAATSAMAAAIRTALAAL